MNKAFSHVGIFFLYCLSLLPMSVLYIIAKVVYLVLYHITGYRKEVVRTNLRNAFPEKTAHERLMIEKNYFKYLSNVILEIVKMTSISKKELQQRFVFKNMHLINDHLRQGTSILVCSAHYGNWEWGTLAMGTNIDVPIYPIYKPLSNKVFDNWFFKMRTRFGNRMTSMKQTYRALTDTKDRPTVFCFGNDQAPPRDESHYWINFLNQQTSVPMGIEKIALKTNRPVFYIKVTVLKRGYYQADCVPLVADPSATTGHEITDLHARFLEKLIQAEPTYWLWSHKRWKHQPAN